MKNPAATVQATDNSIDPAPMAGLVVAVVAVVVTGSVVTGGSGAAVEAVDGASVLGPAVVTSAGLVVDPGGVEVIVVV